MKILFVVTGVGYGDAIRSHAIINEFVKQDPSIRVMIAAYDNSYAYFKGKYPLIRISGYKMRGMSLKFKVLPFIANNYVLPYTWMSVSLKLKKLVSNFNPDVVISDFEPVGIILGKLLKKPSVSIFSYDPVLFKEFKHKNNKLRLEALFFERLYNSSDLTIIPSILGRKESKKYVYVGPIVATKPSDLPSDKKLMKKLKLKRKPILVMLGGSSWGINLARRISSRVAKHFDEDFIIFGSHVKISRRKNIKYYPFKKNFVEYLKVSKGVITLGGNLTLSECVVYKKPMLIFPIKDHVEQILNAYSLRNIAMVKYDLKGLKRTFESFLKNLNFIKSKIPKVEASGSREVVEVIKRL